MSPQEDADFEAMIRLLEWRDPVSDRQLNLPIDRHAPLYEQIIGLQRATKVDLTANELHELPPEIGARHDQHQA
jgi:hypothetical protein